LQKVPYMEYLSSSTKTPSISNKSVIDFNNNNNPNSRQTSDYFFEEEDLNDSELSRSK
jgi:hypothetical protein